MPEIGATLREARMRARIDVSEIEATTKIRAKYLRALENEEWGLLPGPTFVKSFLRTYAQALGLDGKAIVEEYRLHHERPSEGLLEPIVAPAQRGRSRTPPKGPSRGYLVAVGVTAGLILLLVVLLLTDGGGSKTKAPTTGGTPATKHDRGSASKHRTKKGGGSSAGSDVVSLSLHTTGADFVCLIGDGGRKLIPGEELQPEQTTHTYHARHFLLTLGNSSVTLTIDGKARTVEPSSEPIGYSITKAFGRHTLAASERPTCK
ncbi:MAG TPA: helix-turn-helix domain-containing protein [Solirubrobacteraceae bacterium]